MKALYDFILETDKRYNNTVDVDGKELVVNTEITERDAQFVNRLARVVATPIYGDTPIQVGDEVVIHHNIFRRWYDVRGNERNSGDFLDDNQFKAYHDQVFAYKRDGVWRCPDMYCFVEPIKDDAKFRENMYKDLRGILTYTNNVLDDVGLKVGDEVGFTPNSEYRFDIEGKVLYRIYSNDITINYGLKEETTTET